MEMAKTKVDQLEWGNPVVMAFDADEAAFAQLRILKFENYSEEWAKFILMNRNNASENAAHDYDIVIGPIANDTVGAQLWRYETKSIDLPTLVRNLQYMKGLTTHYSLPTP